MAHGANALSPVILVLSKWKSLAPPGWDTNPSQVSSQQMLGGNKVAQILKSRQHQDEIGDLVVGR